MAQRPPRCAAARGISQKLEHGLVAVDRLVGTFQRMTETQASRRAQREALVVTLADLGRQRLRDSKHGGEEWAAFLDWCHGSAEPSLKSLQQWIADASPTLSRSQLDRLKRLAGDAL